MNNTLPEQLLDARGLTCPMPLLKAKLALNNLPIGHCLRVWATDPGSLRDFEVFIKQSTHQLLEGRQVADEFHFLIKKEA